MPKDFNERAMNVPLETFAEKMKQENSPDLIFGQAALEQIRHFDNLRSAMSEWKGPECKAAVISYHTSKSAKLPVVEFTLPYGAGKAVMRDNFYNTKISFELAKPLPPDTFGSIGYFNPEEKINAVYCEGFPEDRVHGSFKQDQCNFTVETSTLGTKFPQNLVYQVYNRMLKLYPELKKGYVAPPETGSTVKIVKPPAFKQK